MTSLEETHNSTTGRRAAIFYGVAAFVSLVGLVDAIYLTVEHLSGNTLRCTIITGCSEVLSSPYASVKGMPLAGLGAFAYFTVFSAATLAAFGYKGAGKFATFVSSLMFLFTLWLIYLQAFVIKAFCQFCLLSALVTTVMTVLIFLARRQERTAIHNLAQ
jgi:uncharacterized membrane protein